MFSLLFTIEMLQEPILCKNAEKKIHNFCISPKEKSLLGTLTTFEKGIPRRKASPVHDIPRCTLYRKHQRRTFRKYQPKRFAENLVDQNKNIGT